jgi:hypothetical protein
MLIASLVVLDACRGERGIFALDSGGASPGGNDTGGPDRPVDAGTLFDAAAGDSAPTCGTCAAYGSARLLGTVADSALDAISGIAASWRNPGVLYVHNDRNQPVFFAVNERGEVLGRFTFAGASPHDLEDIEVARCPAGTCVYLADIGNNIQPLRSELVVFRLPEPEVKPDRPAGAPVPLPFERFTFTYPDGASGHNAESLLIDPGTGTLYVIDKVAAGQPSTVYRLPPLDAARPVKAVKVAELPVPAAGDQPATAASAHPCGVGFLLRTNNTLYEFRIPAGVRFEDAFVAAPAKVPVGVEPQGEAVAYAPDGRGYYTTSEQGKPPIHQVGCQ